MKDDPSGSASLLLRTSGGRVPLGFVSEGPVVYLVARERAARWPVEILREGHAELDIGNVRVNGKVDLITDGHDKTRILGLFRTRYGDARFLQWYDRPARILRISVGPAENDGEPNSARYYSWLEAEFDNVAPDYDRHITGNRINRLLRDRSLATLRPLFQDSHRLLEIGCGSGMETLPLLREGHEVVAVDISPQMLEVTRMKAEREGLADRFLPRCLPARELTRVVAEFGEGSFDGAYSTFGALNCEPDLSFLPNTLHRLLRPRASFVAGVYNRWCLAEIVAYGATLNFRRALARSDSLVLVGNSRFCVDVFPHSEREFRELFSDGFRCTRVQAVPVMLPPSDLAQYADKFARRFDTLARWDSLLGQRWPWATLGDHFLMTLAREETRGVSA